LYFTLNQYKIFTIAVLLIYRIKQSPSTTTLKGGKMYGKWNGLMTEQLDNRVDLAVTTDYRTVLSEFVVKRLKVSKLDTVFPNFKQGVGLDFLV
jgi:hypothetical protein